MKKKILWAMAMVTLGLFLTGNLVSPAYAVEVKLSGQINRAIMWADNGNDSELFHVDNDSSSTRFRLTGDQTFGMITVGVSWETQFESNSSSNVDIGQNSDGTSAFTDRKLEAWFGGNFGRFWIGQGSGAADGTAEVDLSGTTVIMSSSVVDTAGSINFRDDDDNAIAKIDQTRTDFDPGRSDRLRYDTPTFSGFSFSASTTNGDAWEVAGFWSREFDGIGEIAAAIGYYDAADRSDPTYTQVCTSASWLHPSGLNFTISYGQQSIEDRDEDPMNYYAKLGYKWGIHAVAGEYGMTSDLAQDDDESSNFGLAYVITPWNGVEFYGTLRAYTLDRDGVDTNNVNQFMIGTRVKF